MRADTVFAILAVLAILIALGYEVVTSVQHDRREEARERRLLRSQLAATASYSARCRDYRYTVHARHPDGRRTRWLLV
jgi:Tfp pilus assembly protein PilO